MTNVELPARVLAALERSEYDFDSVGVLAQQLGVSEGDVREAIKVLDGQARRPIGENPAYDDWVRAADRGTTWREKWWKFRALAGHTDVGA